MPYSDDENDDYSQRTSSIFSEKPSTASTRPSTVPSKNSFNYSAGSSTNNSKIGRSLRTSNNENLEQDTYNLKILSELLNQYLDQFDSKTPILITETFNKFEPPLQPSNFNSLNNRPYIQNIVRVILTLADSILANNETYRTSRYMVLKAFYQFAIRCNFAITVNFENNMAVPEPSNFCLIDDGDTKITQILETIAHSDSSVISDQDGAFLAPVSRGLSQELSIPTIICGFPKPKSEHQEQINQLCSTFNDIHFVVQKNYIRNCSSIPAPVSKSAPSPFAGPGNYGGITPPFRIPLDPNSVPISISIAANSNSMLSGTLGGYLYPKIDVRKKGFLAEDAKATYAMTCAHVCIDDSNSHPYVSVPSPVLVKLYKEALFKESNKYPQYSQEFIGYKSALQYLENKFPPEAANSKDTGNFGRVVFGERSIVNGRLSDIAIIKCNSSMSGTNHLGTDFPFNQYDPSLMFGNLQIKKIISNIKPGSSVFKFGSTTKYTSGKLNKPKLVYWADNRIQSSEFVISGDKPGFASGGDSGAWILQKLEDCEETEEPSQPQQQPQPQKNGPLGTIYESSQAKDEVKSGLGVVGMLHAYDGEFKQFGLYSPMLFVLSRLEELTKVQWGIVGVSDDKDQNEEVESSEDEEYETDESDNLYE